MWTHVGIQFPAGFNFNFFRGGRRERRESPSMTMLLLVCTSQQLLGRSHFTDEDTDSERPGILPRNRTG